jgi:transposase
LVHETGKQIAQVARDLGINEGTLGNWVARDQAGRNGSDLTKNHHQDLVKSACSADQQH